MVAIAIGLSASTSASAAVQQFVDLSPYGYSANAINNLGDIVGETHNSGYQQGYLLKATSGQPIEKLLGWLAPITVSYFSQQYTGNYTSHTPFTIAWDVNDSDVVAGASSVGLGSRFPPGGENAATWAPYDPAHPSTAAIDRGALAFGADDCNANTSTDPGVLSCMASANAINAAGDIAGAGEYYTNAWTSFPFLLPANKGKLTPNVSGQTSGTPDMTYFKNPAPTGFLVGGINDAKETVVWPDPATPGNANSSAIYPGDHAVPFASNIHQGAHHAINASGWVVGYDSTSQSAKLMEGPGGAVVDLPPLPGGVSSRAGAINDEGDVVGSSTASGGCPSAVLWRHGAYNVPLDLNPEAPAGSSWHLYEADGINNSGAIIGQGSPTGCGTSVPLTPFALVAPINPTLTVALTGKGKGAVTGSAINCPGTCKRSYPTGSLVTLTATPAAGSVFIGWSGACLHAGSCKVTMTGSQNVTASFALLALPSHTRITKTKINSVKHTAGFSFKARGATGFQCALVAPAKKGHKKPAPKFAGCQSPVTYKHLKSGKYTFEVRGVNKAGADRSPAQSAFAIK